MKTDVQPSTAPVLAALEKRIRRCRKCRLWAVATNAVPGEGPADTRVMLVGQNPGTEEDRSGRPFQIARLV